MKENNQTSLYFGPRNEVLHDESNMIVVEPSLVADLQFDTIQVSEGDEPVYRYNSDVTLLFNEQRLKSMSPDNLRKWLSGMYNGSKPVDTSSIPDELLLETVKDKNLQSPSEVRAWSQHLMDRMQELELEYKEAVDQLNAAQLKFTETSSQEPTEESK